MKRSWLVVILMVFAGGWMLIKLITVPPLVKEAKLVEVPEGYTAVGIAHLLKRENIIRRVSWFLFLTHRMKVQGKLQSGIYEFYGRTPLKTVIHKLVQGQVALIKIVIPEGSRCQEIGSILEKKKVITQKDFLEYARQRGLEGFLFPDTYFFPIKVNVDTVVNRMIENFYKQFASCYGQEKLDLTEKEIKKIVIVASIVEKEAQVDSERPIIASVVYNRLKKRLPLQICATVEYALGTHKSRLSVLDLKIDSPYNTYRYRGLPPGPICNPGKKSLLAALHPARTDYLFFVTKGDGTHHFSRTYNEHASAIKIYLDKAVSGETQLAIIVD